MKCHFRVTVAAQIAGGEDEKFPVTLTRYVAINIEEADTVARVEQLVLAAVASSTFLLQNAPETATVTPPEVV